MAETAVSTAIDKLISFLRDEARLLRGVHGQVTLVKDQLALIQAYLRDADAKADRADTSYLTKEWVKQLREVAFRIDDVIDKYLLKVANRRQRREALGTIMARHEIASDIGDIKESIVRLNQVRETFGFNPSADPEASSSSSHGAGSSRRHDPRLGAHFIEEDQLVGVDRTRNLLTDWLSDGESGRTVISVVGEGGLGKTTIVKNVYSKQKDNKSFDCYAWITVSHSLKEEHLLKTMMQNFYEEEGNKYAAKEISETGMDNLTSKIKGYLEGKRYMIVFDDVWEIDFWRGVEFAFPIGNKSRIIITTRDIGVAEFCRCSALVHIHQLEPLNPDNALKLFLLKALQSDPESCPPELMGLSQDFVKRCNGVPLAIEAIAGLLSTRKYIVFEWQRVYGSLRSKFSSDPHLKSYYQVLSESYQDLPCRLKLSLLYFGLFPEDYSIGCARLIRLWIAEGFVNENENEDRILEEVAEEYLDELIRRNLVKVSKVYSYGKVRCCRVHDLMHDFILKKCEEMNFCQVMKNQDFRFNVWTRRLSIHEANEHAGIESARNYGRVRSCFFCVIEEMPKPTVESLFSGFKLLVTLDFENLPLDYLPEAVGNLLNLKYLCLRRTNIKTIPKFIGKLQKLDTLDLRGTRVHELPVEINRLVKLRHLLSYYRSASFNVTDWPEKQGLTFYEGIGRLTALQSLAMVDTSNRDDVIKELKNLKKMRRLGIIKLSKHNGEEVCIAIKSMTHLCSLSIHAAQEGEVLDLQSLIDPPPDLQRLYLDGRIERLPEWIPKLKNLVKLRLGCSRIAGDPLPFLSGLSELVELELHNTNDSDELHFREGWFIKLKNLRIRNMPGLTTLKINKRALRQLEELKLGPCPQLAEPPADIQNLEALKRLIFMEMPPQIIEDTSAQLRKDIQIYYW